MTRCDPQSTATKARALSAARLHVGPCARGFTAVAVVVLLAAHHGSVGLTQPAPAESVPSARLIAADAVHLTGSVDSNSPAIWDLVRGTRRLYVLTSWDGVVRLATGSSVTQLSEAEPVSWTRAPRQKVWMEAVLADPGSGVWYGYYHHERDDVVCEGSGRVLPRIGAARSEDQGRTWQDLGPILEAPPRSYRCDTPNEYFVGGVGDLSVLLDAQSQHVYLFYSQYVRRQQLQGVAVARVAWAGRDAPVGKVLVWARGQWMPPSPVDTLTTEGETRRRWHYPAGTPLYAAAESWHDQDSDVDAFWGPSVHWNTYLKRYVMLLNRARDVSWAQEGIYIAFAASLDDPRIWSTPTRLLEGGSWYPQVMGLETGTGTDKLAGQMARLYMSGHSEHYIVFTR